MAAIICVASLPAVAQTSSPAIQSPHVNFTRHEVRLGVGDMLFETMIWHNQVHKNYSGAPDDALFPENNHYVYLPHIAAEYSYHFLWWISFGCMLDIQHTYWAKEYYNGKNAVAFTTKENFYNLCIMPVVRFNYFRKQHVGLYSSIAAGIDINGGSEKNGFGQNTVVGAALDLRLIGVTAGAGHWWGYFEIGGIYGLQSKDVLFMLNSAIFRAGVSYRF